MLYNVTSPTGPDTRDPRTLDWATRRARAMIPFEIDSAGLPVNPVEPDLIDGLGDLWHWGEAVATDAIVIHIDPRTQTQRLLMIERDDGHGWALPGGCLDRGEDPQSALVRELREETGLRCSATEVEMRSARYVPDPRASRNAWMVTVPGIITIRDEDAPSVQGCDDARSALWVPAGCYEEVTDVLGMLDGRVFPAHVAMLRALLDG